MSVPLIDWLYLNDPITNYFGPGLSNFPNVSIKQGALIVFPRMIDRWNVDSLIVSKWEGYKVVVVTDHPNEFMNTVMDTSGATWTDLELIPFPLLKYSDLPEINRALHNTEIDIILFDDARMLATISPALLPSNKSSTLTVVQPKIIVLTTWGDTLSQLNIVTEKFSDLRLLTLNVISDTANVDWKITRVTMSERQLKFYDQVRVRELKETSNHVVNYPLTRMLTLYAYPDNIMADALVHKYICDTDQSTMPDTLTQNSWLTPSYLDTVCDNGPKLSSILDGVVSNWPAKQLIITRFNHRYGVDLITSFLQLMTLNKRTPYELTEIFHVSCTDEYDTSINTFHKFNASSSAILVTNIIPLIPLKGVSIIHVADSYSFMNLRTIIDRTHKRYLNKYNNDLLIYSHLATHPTEKSSDEVLHEHLATHIREANRIYTGLISIGSHIVFDPNLGLIVL